MIYNIWWFIWRKPNPQPTQNVILFLKLLWQKNTHAHTATTERTLFSFFWLIVFGPKLLFPVHLILWWFFPVFDFISIHESWDFCFVLGLLCDLFLFDHGIVNFSHGFCYSSFWFSPLLSIQCVQPVCLLCTLQSDFNYRF